MLKRLTRYGIALTLALAVTTLAFPAPRSSTDGRGSVAQLRTAAPTQGALTIHRLLRGSLSFSLTLTQALRLLEQPVVEQPEYGPTTIIDEPDPAGLSEGNEPPPEDDGDGGDGDSNERDEPLNHEVRVPLTQIG